MNTCYKRWYHVKQLLGTKVKYEKASYCVYNFNLYQYKNFTAHLIFKLSVIAVGKAVVAGGSWASSESGLTKLVNESGHELTSASKMSNRRVIVSAWRLRQLGNRSSVTTTARSPCFWRFYQSIPLRIPLCFKGWVQIMQTTEVVFTAVLRWNHCSACCTRIFVFLFTSAWRTTVHAF